MKQVFAGNVFDMVKKPDGLVFSYLEEVVDGDFYVKYKMVDSKTGAVSDILKNVYLIAKFGSNYKAALKLIGNHITVRSINLPSGKLFLCDRENGGNCFLLDGFGSVLWTGPIRYRDNAPSDIALYGNCIWASFASNNVLIRFNLATMREELRIGGTRSPFDAPRGVFIEGNTAVVSNSGSNRLTKVNLDTYAVEQYCEFSRGVRSYINVEGNEYVLLEDGIYKI